MIVFQWLTIPLLLLLSFAELRGLFQGRGSAVWRLFRMTLWGVAAAMIAWPTMTTALAHLLGIGRGADLLLYLLMLATPLALFHLYAKHFSLQREIVELARRDALRTAVAGRGLSTTWLRPETQESTVVENGRSS